MKAFFGGTRYRIAIDEMPDTRDVVDLLEGIYIARREGDFYQETLLQESDGYRQKSRLNCFAPRSLYVMYCSLALLISICRRPSCGSTEARRASRASRATTSCATNGKSDGPCALGLRLCRGVTGSHRALLVSRLAPRSLFDPTPDDGPFSCSGHESCD